MVAYTITKTDGSTLVTVPDTERNDDYGVTLIGRNYSGYGVFLNDNFVALMENFSNDTAPGTPLDGQLWWKNDENTLRVWQGSTWKTLGFSAVTSTPPASTGRNVGDFWYDTGNLQLNVWNNTTSSNVVSALTTTGTEVSLASSDSIRIGDLLTTSNVASIDNVRVTQILSTSNVRISSAAAIYNSETVQFIRDSGWYILGPTYSKTQKETGIIPRDIVDADGIPHVAGIIYQNGRVIGSISRDNEYRPRTADAIDRLPLIKPGITLLDDSSPQIVHTILADVTGSGGSTIIPISTVDDLLGGETVITTGIDYSSGVTVLSIFPGNNSVRISAATSVYENDAIVFQRGAAQSSLFNGTAANAQRLNGKLADRFVTLDVTQAFQADVSVEGNLYVGDSFLVWDRTNDVEIRNLTRSGNISFVANVPSFGNVRALNVYGTTGEVQVSSAPTSAMGVANKAYADNLQGVALAAITANVSTLIGTASASRRDFGNVSNVLDQYNSNFTAVNAAVALRATIASPEFTGEPLAPTPSSSDSSTKIATTAYVTGAIATSTAAWRANASVQDAAINLKAPINSPSLTGTPTAPTPDSSDISSNIATTAFVSGLISSLATSSSIDISAKAPIASPTFTGTTRAPTAANLTYPSVAGSDAPLGLRVQGGDNTVATTGFVANAIALMRSANLQPYATRVDAVLEGNPTAPTPPGATDSTRIATTAFVKHSSPVLSVNSHTGEVVLELADIVGAAPTDSPEFTGTVIAPTPTIGTNNTEVATTEFVRTITDTLAPKSNPSFTGTITMVTPNQNSDTGIAASTAWVNTKLTTASVPKWGGSAKFVSTAAPLSNQGTDGDIWFQYAV